MKIFRKETFQIEPSENENIEDIWDIIKKSQDLTIVTALYVSHCKTGEAPLVYEFDVKRKLECLPDTIK